METWTVVEFSLARAAGRLRHDVTGEERGFTIDDWVPCPPAQRAQLRPGEELLLTGERVHLRSASDGRAQVSPVHRALVPLRTFLDWFEALQAHLPALGGWSAAVWDQIMVEADEDLSDTVRSNEPGRPDEHLGLLVCLASAGPPIARERLGWLNPAPLEGQPLAAIVGEEDFAGLALPAGVMEALSDEGLLLRVSGAPATAT